MPVVNFTIRLEPTYWTKGFFNGNQPRARFFQEWHRVGDSVRMDVLSDRSIRIHSKAG